MDAFSTTSFYDFISGSMHLYKCNTQYNNGKIFLHIDQMEKVFQCAIDFPCIWDHILYCSSLSYCILTDLLDMPLTSQVAVILIRQGHSYAKFG